MNNSDSENEKNGFFINNYNYNEQPPDVDENNIYYIMNKSDSDKNNENNNKISTKENINNKNEDLNQNKKKEYKSDGKFFNELMDIFLFYRRNG